MSHGVTANSRNGMRRLRHLPVLASGIMILMACTLLSPSSRAQDAPALSVEAGQEAFRHYCLACHNELMKVGPDLVHGTSYFISAGVAHEDIGKLLFQKVRVGDEGSVMPQFTPDEVSDMDLMNIGYFLASHYEAPAVVPAYGSADNGEELFSRSCEVCHGEGGSGTQLAPPLSMVAAGMKGAGLEYSAFHGLTVLAARSGEFKLMPVIPEEKLSDGDLADIAAYLWENAPELPAQ